MKVPSVNFHYVRRNFLAQSPLFYRRDGNVDGMIGKVRKVEQREYSWQHPTHTINR